MKIFTPGGFVVDPDPESICRRFQLERESKRKRKTSSREGVCSPENSSDETRSVQRSIQNITKFEGVDQDPPSFPRRPDLAKSSTQSVTLEFKSRGFPLGLNIDCIAFN